MVSYEGNLCTHRLNGEWSLDNIYYHHLVTKERLDIVANQLLFDKDDVIVATYPKSGTTWIRYIMILLKSYKYGKVVDNSLHTFPYLEFEPWCSVEKLMNRPKPRYFATHLYYRQLAKHVDQEQVKCIYVRRNPKDVLVSFFHFYRMYDLYGDFREGLWQDFFNLVQQDKISNGNVLDFNVGWWEASKRHPRTILTVTFEEMIENIRNVIRKVAHFLQIEVDEDHVEWVAEKASFNSMKNNPATNYATITGMDHSISPFMRKGQVGDWKNYFTVAQNEWMDDQINQKMKDSGITFSYD